MKIGLIFPNKDRRYRTVHLGLAYIAAYAREQHDDLEFHVLDTRVATRHETNRFFTLPFDLIGITVFSPVYNEVISLFDRIKGIKNDVPVCLGGPYVTTIQDQIFQKTPAEYAVYGEGEITFSELIHALKGNIELKDIRGLMYRNMSGEYIKNGPRELIENLDSLPFPAYDLFKMERYPLHRLVTSRGCPYACSWCNSSSIWSATWRKRSAANVYTEIEFLIENYGKKTFGFNDNSFNIDEKHVEEFCDLLIRNRTGILWSTPVRVEKISPELAARMKLAGCYNVSVGIESANDRILFNMGKKVTIEKLTRGIRAFKEAGIEVLGQFVIGSPGDTLATIMESVEYAKNSALDYINFYTVLPFKGTPQWEYVTREGRLYSNEIHSYHTIKPRIVFDTPEFPYEDRLKAIKLVKKAGFYSNKDKKNRLFDLAKEITRRTQLILPESVNARFFMFLKRIYRLNFVKKNNV
jgi:anaerobic magnesium-protoporphyrin IX monomethyl ester cyclase